MKKTAKELFHKEQAVQLSSAGKKVFSRIDNFNGVIVGFSHDENCVQFRREGTKYPVTLHHTFVMPIPNTEANLQESGHAL